MQSFLNVSIANHVTLWYNCLYAFLAIESAAVKQVKIQTKKIRINTSWASDGLGAARILCFPLLFFCSNKVLLTSSVQK